MRDIYAISQLVLQLSNQPESFGRTVIEALALCRPVLGYAHGGVGELLAELYPEGRVPVGDTTRLVERAAELLRVGAADSAADALPPRRHAGRHARPLRRAGRLSDCRAPPRTVA